MNDQDQLSPTGASRRAVLAGGGAACLALLLGACGSDTETPPANTGTGGGPADAPSSAAPGGGSTGTVLAKEADIPSGGGVVVGTVLVVKLADGTVKAYDAHCPHMGTLVKPPTDGKSECPNHNSLFAIEDGARLSGPATSGLKDIPVKVENGNVVAQT
ncbi:Rieske (2Fe-2S) protein [Luedemannella helvata]|uniref:Rieske domain-containing protein n=1 Tax=Luedemannella helvata TaxID=349315 RepID=A0ABN2KMI8_9ACTN